MNVGVDCCFLVVVEARVTGRSSGLETPPKQPEQTVATGASHLLAKAPSVAASPPLLACFAWLSHSNIRCADLNRSSRISGLLFGVYAFSAAR